MTRNRSDLGPVTAAIVGVVACAACCAGPLLALSAAIGVTSAVAAIWVPALALLALASMVGIWRLRRRRVNACPVPQVVDVHAPTFCQGGQHATRQDSRLDVTRSLPWGSRFRAPAAELIPRASREAM